MQTAAKIFIVAGIVAAASGLLSPPVALAAGIFYGLSFFHPYQAQSRKLSKLLLQASVVALGFGMNLHEVVKAGERGFVYTALGITAAMLTGLAIGRLLAVRGNSSYLIATGTAICGGSAIAAVGPLLHADEEEMAVSLGTVFILNSVALLIFPPTGAWLHLTQEQFGLWAALAIHDTSSVVGAASKYGASALVIATTVKLARALWIVPLALVTAGVKRSKSKITLPWFILFFCLAAVFNTYLPALRHVTASLFVAGRLGLTATLFLIGSGISRATVNTVGWRPMLQGVLLWILVGLGSLALIRAGFIAL